MKHDESRPTARPFRPHRLPFHFLLYIQFMAVLIAYFVIAVFGHQWGAASKQKGYAEPAAQTQSEK
jgi:hypothetical protein